MYQYFKKKPQFNRNGYQQQLDSFEGLRQAAQVLADCYNDTGLPPLATIEEFSRLYKDYEQLLFEKVQEAGNEPGITSAAEVVILPALAPLCNGLAQGRAEGHRKALSGNSDPVLADFNIATPMECRIAEGVKLFFDYQAGQVVFKQEFLQDLKACFLN